MACSQAVARGGAPITARHHSAAPLILPRFNTSIHTNFRDLAIYHDKKQSGLRTSHETSPPKPPTPLVIYPTFRGRGGENPVKLSPALSRRVPPDSSLFSHDPNGRANAEMSQKNCKQAAEVAGSG